MNERRQDFEWLQRFTRDGEQSAFADVVRRHLDLVFATALRKVEDAGAAQEVAQNVFAALARKAWRFAPDDSLPAWLHKAALLESKSWLRGELGRRRREQTAAELGTTMNTIESEPAFQALVPLLDEALLSLREKDRTALLLRFYESHSLREVGAAVGASEDAARMRVQSALEKLAEFYKRRGFKTATVATTAAALQHTATTASAAVVSAVVNAALQAAPPALAGLGALLARLRGLSRGRRAALGVALAVALLFWLWRDRGAAGRERQLQPIATQPAAGSNNAARLQTNVAGLRAETARPEQPNAPLTGVAARPVADTGELPPTRRLLPAAWKATWAPDSKRLAFSRYGDLVEVTNVSTGNKVVPGRTRRSDGISVLDLESGKVTDLTPEGKDPAWSPDGKFIAYAVLTFGGAGYLTNSVWVVPAQGGEPVKIREGGFPAWTPDSKRVLFPTVRSPYQILSVGLYAPQEEPTVFFANPTSLYSAISPDGSRIAGGERGIEVFDTKTGQLLASLTNTNASFFTGWSPDGRQVAFGGGSRWPGLWIFDVERGGAYLVAKDGTMPAWSPDGKRLVYDIREGPRDGVMEQTRELWVMETASLPRNPVLTNQLPPRWSNQVSAPAVK